MPDALHPPPPADDPSVISYPSDTTPSASTTNRYAVPAENDPCRTVAVMDEPAQEVGVQIVRFVQLAYVALFPISTLALALSPTAIYTSSYVG